MNERIKSEARKIVLATTALASATFFVACGDSKSNSPEPTLPPNFSRNTEDYKFRIVINTGGNKFHLYTKNEPSLETNGGSNLLKAEDIYCPDLNSVARNAFNCDEFVKGLYEIATDYDIAIATNQQNQQ